jgi:hypothetical protein
VIFLGLVRLVLMPRNGFLSSLLILGAIAAAPYIAQSQAVVPFSVFPEEATPIGALPPMALPMPASRDQNYWGFRLQAGERRGRGGPEDLFSLAGGIDYQLRGGSIFGLTAGYQHPQNCQSAVSDCSRHSLFGARGRFNVFTGGPTIASIIGDESATSTLGTEIGFGYAPRLSPGVNACTLDVGLPYSIAMLQTVRFVPFVTPGAVWDIDCSSQPSSGSRSFLLGFGFGLQQLGARGLDVNFGAQRIFRGTTGMQFGISVSWVRLP